MTPSSQRGPTGTGVADGAGASSLVTVPPVAICRVSEQSVPPGTMVVLKHSAPKGMSPPGVPFTKVRVKSAMSDNGVPLKIPKIGPPCAPGVGESDATAVMGLNLSVYRFSPHADIKINCKSSMEEIQIFTLLSPPSGLTSQIPALLCG